QLGYRYIWIDALRIIQNNKADVEREILQMPYIYKNAELTICASTAKSCSDGFLQVRPEYSEFHMPLILRNGSQGIIYFDSYQFASPPLGEILATRAWAFQERLLSPRLLQYGWRATRWTCACDNGYGGQNGLSLNNAKYNHFLHVSPFGLRLFPRSREELFDGWATLVAKYSNLILSRQEDRLAAIGGLAQELQRITGVRYLAGLWDYEKLPSLLQWNAISTHKLSSRPRPSQAPTWSWAGVNGPV
ncbi:HET-domain-containing protein, partial [Tothia fuscella]